MFAVTLIIYSPLLCGCYVVATFKLHTRIPVVRALSELYLHTAQVMNLEKISIIKYKNKVSEKNSY